MPKKPRSLQQFVDALGAQNVSVAEWARKNGFPREMVYGILRGRLKGRRGQTRDALERMGVQPPPVISVRAGPSAASSGERRGGMDRRSGKDRRSQAATCPCGADTKKPANRKEGITT